MSKELTTTSPEQLAKLQELTGLAPKNEYNTIRFINSAMVDKTPEELEKDPKGSKKKPNPDYGKLFAEKQGESVEIDMSKAEFYVARQRVHITCNEMIETERGKASKYWCRESDDGFFVEVNDRDGNVVASGAYRDLKADYSLKWNNVIYVYYEGDVYRWKLSTAHDWFGISKTLGKNPAQTIRVASCEEDTSGSFPYYKLSFEIASPFDADKAVEISSQVAAMLNEYYNKQAAEAQMKPKQIEDVPYDEAGKDPELEDLPF